MHRGPSPTGLTERRPDKSAWPWSQAASSADQPGHLLGSFGSVGMSVCLSFLICKIEIMTVSVERAELGHVCKVLGRLPGI